MSAEATQAPPTEEVVMTQALIGAMSITISDGTELTAGSDIQLAWKWAEAEHNIKEPGSWAAMSYRDQCASVSEALAELRRAYAATE